MRVLLDESLPRSLIPHLVGLTVETVFDRGWAGMKNGILLDHASAEFGVFLTADQNLRYQQNLAGFDIGVVVLAARSNRVEDLVPLVPEAINACQTAGPGVVVVVRT